MQMLSLHTGHRRDVRIGKEPNSTSTQPRTDCWERARFVENPGSQSHCLLEHLSSRRGGTGSARMSGTQKIWSFVAAAVLALCAEGNCHSRQTPGFLCLTIAGLCDFTCCFQLRHLKTLGLAPRRHLTPRGPLTVGLALGWPALA